MKEIIQIKNIVKQFGNRVVLNGIDLSVNEGDLITIMGESGAGKTTLLSILAFFDTQSSGQYKFDGQQISNAQERNRIRNMNMGFVFQSYNLIPNMTVYDNIVLPIYYSLSSNKQKEEYLNNIKYTLKRFNIDHIVKSYVDYISGGEKQRVCLARAISCNARVIICDEPTGNLDNENTQIVLNELKKINQQGKTVIIVTHDKEIEKIATKKFYLKEGKLISHEI